MTKDRSKVGQGPEMFATKFEATVETTFLAFDTQEKSLFNNYLFIKNGEKKTRK